MTIKANNLICASCKLEILEKIDVAALKDEIVHQSCKNEWLKFQNAPKLESLDPNVHFVNQTFENQSIGSIITDLGYSIERTDERENNEPNYRFGRNSNLYSTLTPGTREHYQHTFSPSRTPEQISESYSLMVIDRNTARRIGIGDIIQIKCGERIIKTRLLQKEDKGDDEVELSLRLLEESEERQELTTYFQQFELTYPEDFENRIARLSLNETGSNLLLGQLKATLISQDLEILEFDLYNHGFPSFFHRTYIRKRDSETRRPFIPPRLISNLLDLKIVNTSDLKPFGLFLTFEIIR